MIEAKPDYYYTCYTDEGLEPDALHVTHKWLGYASDYAVMTIKEEINTYFQKKHDPYLMPRVLFDQVDFFGPKYKRVLKCDTRYKKYFHLDLRAKLDAIYPDQYQWWQPHVTTENDPFFFRLSRFCLMKNKEILQEWKVVTK